MNLNGRLRWLVWRLIAMADDNGDGIYAVTVDLPLLSRAVEFKFTLDGWTNQ